MTTKVDVYMEADKEAGKARLLADKLDAYCQGVYNTMSQEERDETFNRQFAKIKIPMGVEAAIYQAKNTQEENVHE